MGFCSFANCSRTSTDGSYLPLKNKRQLKAWIKRIGRAEGTFIPTENSYVCGVSKKSQFNLYCGFLLPLIMSKESQLMKGFWKCVKFDLISFQLHFLESDWEIKNGERKLKAGVIPQPVRFKKEDETPTRKRKPNSKYSSDEPHLPKQAKDEVSHLRNELREAKLEIAKKEFENSQLNCQNRRLTTMLEKVFNKDQISGIGKHCVPML
jgi:hypothetical protein